MLPFIGKLNIEHSPSTAFLKSICEFIDEAIGTQTNVVTSIPAIKRSPTSGCPLMNELIRIVRMRMNGAKMVYNIPISLNVV